VHTFEPEKDTPAMPRILTIVTNANTLHLTDGTEHPSGYWAEELAVPHEIFRNAGFEVEIATIDGRAPTVDASSLDPQMLRWVVPQGAQVDLPVAVQQWRRTLSQIGGLERPLDLSVFTRQDLERYDGIYIAGGHGCMTDMPSAYAIARTLGWAQERRLPIGAVCHGPTALLAPRDAEGRNPFAGYAFTSFSQQEETLTPIWGRLPMVIQYELEAQGLKYSRAELPWDSHVVRDRNLVTGQNPFSSRAIADAFVALVSDQPH
jgi:putative intracellular protease/amidase